MSNVKKLLITCITALTAVLLIAVGFTVSNTVSQNSAFAAQSAPVKLTLSSGSLVLGKGESYQLTANVGKDDAVRKWVSSDTSVLTVKNGLIQTKKTGEATVTVRTNSNQAATCHVVVMKAPKSCTLNADDLLLGVGESFRFYCTVPSGTAACVRDYTISSKSVLSYDRVTIKALKAGTATVTVKLYNGVTASCKVTVKAAPKSCTLSAKELVIGAGESYRFTCNVPNNTAARVRTYSVKGNSILSLDGSTVKGLKAGTTTVTVKLFNGVTDTCKVTVKPAPKSCTLSAKQLTLGVGESFRFSCNIPSGTAARVRNYTVDNPHFLDCDGKGTITGRKPGTTTVRVTLFNGVTDTCKVTVRKAPDTATLSASSLTLGISESYQFSCTIPSGTAARVRTYLSSDYSVVSCSATGKITAKKTGSAVITVKLFNGVTATCKVTVKNAPSSLSFAVSSLCLVLGDSAQLQPVLPSNTASHHRTYSVSNSSVISCTRSGKITALGQGTAKVTLKLYNGVSASCTVEVTATAPSINVEDDLAVLDIGETFRIRPLTESGAEYRSITYVSGDKTVATVDANGVIHAKAPGTTDITLKTSSGKKARVAVIVWGNKDIKVFPDADAVDAQLDQIKLSAPMKTNCYALDSLVSDLLSRITNSRMSISQKVRACYDYLAQNSTYGYVYSPVDLPGIYDYDSDYFIVTQAYSIFKNHIGTCEDFASAFTVLMRRIGIEANVVYGLVGMAAGGKGDHYWTDIPVMGRHLVFDTQVENNTLGPGNYVNHYWYGMAPEYNWRCYEYQEFVPVMGFGYH